MHAEVKAFFDTLEGMMTPNDELLTLLAGFRETLAANQATHQSNADAATATIASATDTLTAETATVAGYADALADLDAEIAKLTPPPSNAATASKGG